MLRIGIFLDQNDSCSVLNFRDKREGYVTVFPINFEVDSIEVL